LSSVSLADARMLHASATREKNHFGEVPCCA
jgi:hypothetical protein